MDTKTIPSKSLSEALNDELLETIDEELELEFDDQRLIRSWPHPPAAARRRARLIKFRDRVVHQKLKLVVLFEGRDAAGKGGVMRKRQKRDLDEE